MRLHPAGVEGAHRDSPIRACRHGDGAGCDAIGDRDVEDQGRRNIWGAYLDDYRCDRSARDIGPNRHGAIGTTRLDDRLVRTGREEQKEQSGAATAGEEEVRA